MLGSTTIAGLMLLHLGAGYPSTEIRFILMASANSISDLEEHTEQAFAYTQTHFALYRVEKTQSIYVACITEPDNFNELQSRRSIQAAPGTYQIIPVPTLDACKNRYEAEAANGFLFSLAKNEVLEVSCRENGEIEPTCRRAIADTYE